MRLVHDSLEPKPFTAKDAKDAKENRGGMYRWRRSDIEVPDSCAFSRRKRFST